MTIARANNSILKVISGGGMTPIKGTVELFGKTYPTIKINGLEYLCENLDYKWQGLSIGYTDSSIPAALYQNNDESTWGWEDRKCGLLYNYEAMSYLDDTILSNSDWRVFTKDDFGSLLISTKSYYECAPILCENVEWASSVWNGTNDLGFNGKPCGAYIDNHSENENTGIYLQIKTGVRDFAYRRYGHNEDYRLFTVGTYSGKWFTPIRLCRNT